MQFERRRSVTLYTQDGALVVAAPIYASVATDFVLWLESEDGDLIYVEDESAGLFRRATTGQRLFLHPPAP
jgi:hypothetical protein